MTIAARWASITKTRGLSWMEIHTEATGEPMPVELPLISNLEPRYV